MKELGITKGEWEISPDNNWECCILMGDQENHYINLENRDIDGWDEMHANATLIVDAGNTAQKCGLLPSELLQQRDELKEALAEMIWQFGYRSTYEGRESLHTGGLSALESAFGALGLSDPIALLDFEAAESGWYEDDSNYYYPYCYSFDDDDDLVLKDMTKCGVNAGKNVTKSHVNDDKNVTKLEGGEG